jgi:hypothetical protein
VVVSCCKHVIMHGHISGIYSWQEPRCVQLCIQLPVSSGGFDVAIQLSKVVASPFMESMPAEDKNIQLGQLCGAGSFGRVYKARWGTSSCHFMCTRLWHGRNDLCVAGNSQGVCSFLAVSSGGFDVASLLLCRWGGRDVAVEVAGILGDYRCTMLIEDPANKNSCCCSCALCRWGGRDVAVKVIEHNSDASNAVESEWAVDSAAAAAAAATA